MVQGIGSSIPTQRIHSSSSTVQKSAKKVGLAPIISTKPTRASNILASKQYENVTVKELICSTDSQNMELTDCSLDVRMQKECFNLLRNKQYRSCEMLTMYHISSLSGTDQGTAKLKAVAYEILGDSIMQQNQANRAITYYRQAISYLRASSPPVGRNFGNVLQVQTMSEANLKLKESKCLSQIGKSVEAISVLELSVPITHQLRTFSISMELGNLHMINGRMKDAKTNFLDALSRNIYAIEAIEKLVFLNAERSEVMRAINNGLQHDTHFQDENQESNEDVVESMVPISDIVTAYFYSQRSTHSHQQNALILWEKLHLQYPKNIHILLQMALLQMRNPSLEPNLNATQMIFEKIRASDQKFLDGMDRYALLLCNQNDVTKLCRLSLEFMDISDKQPESWSTLALYYKTCNDPEKALDMIEKALSLDNKNSFCYLLKGQILLLQKQPDLAAASFFRANEIEQNLSHYEGMIESVISAKRYKEAVALSKEALNFAPRDCRALTLVGLALSKAASSSSRDVSATKDRAIKALRKAISLDPFSLRPILALIDLYMAESNFEECENLLKSAIDIGSNNSVLSPLNQIDHRQVTLQKRLGDIYADSKQFVKALTHYHRALSLDPRCEEAKRGVEDMEMATKK